MENGRNLQGRRDPVADPQQAFVCNWLPDYFTSFPFYRTGKNPRVTVSPTVGGRPEVYRKANEIKWAVYGAIIGLVIGAAIANFGLLDGLRPYGFSFLDLGYTGSTICGAFIGGLAAIIRNWWQRQS